MNRSHLLLALALATPFAASAQRDCVSLTAAACSHGSGDTSTAATVAVQVNGGSTCTGVVLARTSASTSEMGVLMAEHCMPGGVAAGSPVRVTLFFNAVGACTSDDKLRTIAETASSRLDASGTLVARDPLLTITNPDGSQSFTGTDAGLVVVNMPAPSGVYYAGWSAQPLAAGSAVEAIGHGKAKQQTIAAGSSKGDARPNANFFQSNPTRGLILGGHSGSPVFNSVGQVVGTMSDATCGGNSHEFIAGRFEKIYPMLRSYIDPTASGALSTGGYFAAGSSSGGTGISSSGGSSGMGTSSGVGPVAPSAAASAGSAGGGGAFGVIVLLPLLAGLALRRRAAA